MTLQFLFRRIELFFIMMENVQTVVHPDEILKSIFNLKFNPPAFHLS